MSRLLKILLSLPRTIAFNLRYLPISQAIRLPIWLATNVRVKNMWRGGIRLESVATGIIRIGYHEADGIDVYGRKSLVDIKRGGVLTFKQDAHIGHGAIICVNANGRMSVGKNFAVSGTTSFVCNNEIAIGDDVQFSWDSNVMDSDAHAIYDADGSSLSMSVPITIGNHVWIAAKTTLLKGTVIPDGCVVGINSMTNKAFSLPNHIIAGAPAKPLRQISNWHI